ncbi:MAG: zinc ribbon domain-containing protein [Leptospira sp.]|nr:zinc ribbon domain-containing protein [Leptospira sp.]
MPTYDYKCMECSKVFEHFQSIKSEPLTHCLCGKNGKVERQISFGGGIIFKGSGFYVNDYKKDSSSSAPKDSGAGQSSPAPTPASPPVAAPVTESKPVQDKS